MKSPIIANVELAIFFEIQNFFSCVYYGEFCLSSKNGSLLTVIAMGGNTYCKSSRVWHVGLTNGRVALSAAQPVELFFTESHVLKPGSGSRVPSVIIPLWTSKPTSTKYNPDRMHLSPVHQIEAKPLFAIAQAIIT